MRVENTKYLKKGDNMFFYRGFMCHEIHIIGKSADDFDDIITELIYLGYFEDHGEGINHFEDLFYKLIKPKKVFFFITIPADNNLLTHGTWANDFSNQAFADNEKLYMTCKDFKEYNLFY